MFNSGWLWFELAQHQKSNKTPTLEPDSSDVSRCHCPGSFWLRPSGSLADMTILFAGMKRERRPGEGGYQLPLRMVFFIASCDAPSLREGHRCRATIDEQRLATSRRLPSVSKRNNKCCWVGDWSGGNGSIPSHLFERSSLQTAQPLASLYCMQCRAVSTAGSTAVSKEGCRGLASRHAGHTASLH